MNGIRDGARVFVGGITVAAFAFFWWEGYLFRPMAEPVAVALSGEMPQSDGNLKSGGTSDILANVLAGVLWFVGSAVTIAITIAWNITKTITKMILKAALSFTEGGRGLLQAWESHEADQQASYPVVHRNARDNLQRGGVDAGTEGRAALAAQTEALEMELATSLQANDDDHEEFIARLAQHHDALLLTKKKFQNSKAREIDRDQRIDELTQQLTEIVTRLHTIDSRVDAIVSSSTIPKTTTNDTSEPTPAAPAAAPAEEPGPPTIQVTKPPVATVTVSVQPTNDNPGGPQQ